MDVNAVFHVCQFIGQYCYYEPTKNNLPLARQDHIDRSQTSLFHS